MNLLEEYNIKFKEGVPELAISLGREISEWLCRIQYPSLDAEPLAGSIPFCIYHDSSESIGNQWNVAFAVMAWLSAYKAFGDEKYLAAALSGGRYLKSLQIFDPFSKQHYGAIREMTPQTSWCYPRDSISAGWSFIELYRATGNEEYLIRAKLLGEWFIREAFDDDGWPYWSVQLEEFFDNENLPQTCNDVQGCFHGGTLNFFYQLALATGDEKWIGCFFVKMADYFVEHIQQPDGFFRSIQRSTRKPPANDPQRGLHRANDDLGTLGLLCAYKITSKAKYLLAIERYISAVFERQDSNGMFESSIACIPVILNTLHEANGLIRVPLDMQSKLNKAINALFLAKANVPKTDKKFGAIYEEPYSLTPYVCARANCYALIVLLKLFCQVEDFLSVTVEV